MNVSKLSPKFISSILLALFFGLALYFRVYFPYDQVFVGDWVKNTGIDAYHYMRMVDNLAHNFPRLISFDPYFVYPGGHQVGNIHFFDWLLAGIIWMISFGSPTQHTIDVAGVYYPAVLGALTVIPAYFMGKELFGRWAGIISAGLLAVLPGEFLGRSILGFTDTPAAETLLTATAMMFLILALKSSRQRQLTFSHLKQRDWAMSTRPLIYSLLAGIFLGIYFITWQGALLFGFIISTYFVIQFIIDHLKRQSTDYLCLVGATLFLITLIISVPLWSTKLYLFPLIIALLIPLVLSSVSRLMVSMASKGIKPAYYPLTLIGMALVGLAIFYLISPSLLSRMLGLFQIFSPTGATAVTTMEMQPLLFPQGELTLILAWGNFTTSFFLSLISLGILIYLVIKHGNAEKSLLLVWSLVILAATLGQRRFAYYFAVNVALLSGYLSWQILRLAGFKEWILKPAEIPQVAAPQKTKPEKRRKDGFSITIRHINMALAVIVVFFVVFFWNIGPSLATAKQARFAPTDAWISSLSWMKENTPEPFGDPNYYYHLYEPVPQKSHQPPESGASISELVEWIRLQKQNYDYPESAYGVMAWWDYGYWITRIAHRLPNNHPGQPPIPITLTANFFLSQDEDSVQEIIEALGSAYIIIDNKTATSKLWAIAEWAGKDKAQFYDEYYLPQENKLAPVVLFYPEYYRSLMVRLYNFDGKAVTPEVTAVISYEKQVSREGKPIKVITDIQPFFSYEEAMAHISSQKSDSNYKIVGTNPFDSPVPLDALKHYQLIHASDEVITLPGTETTIPEVKIFAYIK